MCLVQGALQQHSMTKFFRSLLKAAVLQTPLYIQYTKETFDETRQYNLSGASKSSCSTGRSLEIRYLFKLLFLTSVKLLMIKTWLSQSVFMVISEFTHHTEAWAGGVGRGPDNHKLLLWNQILQWLSLEKILKQQQSPCCHSVIKLSLVNININKLI